MIEAIVREINISPPLLPFKPGSSAYQGLPKGAALEMVDANIQAATKGEIISSLYFGGGTPSILESADLKLIFEALHDRFVFTGDIEITIEVNPDDITALKLKEWQKLGINRLSVGIQSFSEEELAWMNRAHTAAESIICIDQIKQAGFTNFSVDLIYGSPVLSNDGWKKNVTAVIERGIPHISCYALTVEPKTALAKLIALHKKSPVDSEKQADQFLLLMDWMDQWGYEHYEISNFAKPGFRSRHNSSYWQGERYYGFGPAAHAYDGRRRKWNIANNALYIQSLRQNTIPVEEEALTEVQRLNEYIMTSLRLLEGLNLDHVGTHFGDDKSKSILEAGNKYVQTGNLVLAGNHLKLTREGKLFADGIAADLFF